MIRSNERHSAANACRERRSRDNTPLRRQANSTSHRVKRGCTAKQHAADQQHAYDSDSAISNPTSLLLQQFEHDPIAALLHFAEASGFDAVMNHSSAGTGGARRPSVPPVSAEQMSERMHAFNAAMAPNLPIRGCASCGTAHIDDGGFKVHTWDSLGAAVQSLLRLDNAVRWCPRWCLPLTRPFSLRLQHRT